MYNILLYTGISLIVFGFALFLYSQHKIREAEIEWKLDQAKATEQKMIKDNTLGIGEWDYKEKK